MATLLQTKYGKVEILKVPTFIQIVQLTHWWNLNTS